MKAWKALGPEHVVLEQYEPEKVGKNQVKNKNAVVIDKRFGCHDVFGQAGMKPFPIIWDARAWAW